MTEWNDETPAGYRAAKEGDLYYSYDDSKSPSSNASKQLKTKEEGTFIKSDSSKNRLELLEPKFIEGIGSVITFGANKYEDNNWKKAGGTNEGRIKGALLRHIYAYLDGEKIDPETGKSHLYHAGCNLMFLDYFDRVEKTKGESK